MSPHLFRDGFLCCRCILHDNAQISNSKKSPPALRRRAKSNPLEGGGDELIIPHRTKYCCSSNVFASTQTIPVRGGRRRLKPALLLRRLRQGRTRGFPTERSASAIAPSKKKPANLAATGKIHFLGKWRRHAYYNQRYIAAQYAEIRRRSRPCRIAMQESRAVRSDPNQPGRTAVSLAAARTPR